MQLKRYQKIVLEQTRGYLEALQRSMGTGQRYPSMLAWEDTGHTRGYMPHKNGLGNDMPIFCIKVPTGGGKTLLATQVLGQIFETILRVRNGAGLALWAVPSDQIYKDTLRRLRDRRDPYRESLEFAVSRRIEVWEKHEIARLTPGQLRENLNILVFKMAAAVRQNQDYLRMFQDSGGNIVQHFPPEEDGEAHRKLKSAVPNLDMVSDELTKTSLGNLIRLCEPPVILDEGHKTYSEKARKTLAGFNPSIVVELSATPPAEANVLVRVSGQELLAEEMIKLPINIASSGETDWKTCLGKAKEKRDELERQARALHGKHGGHIRPIALVQVERTGKDQVEARRIHADHVRKELIEKLGVMDAEIKIKTAETDGLEDIDLLDEGCPVRWIITKSALQEGWDCPFAYLLVTLNPTQSQLAMTQLLGRVLRQPDGRKTGVADLDESWVFCLRKRSRQILAEVKLGLEREGYEGDESSIIDKTEEAEDPVRPTSLFRKEFRSLYKSFKGKIYLPRFCVKNGAGHDGLDYFRHLISEVDVARFRYESIEWDLAGEMERARETFFRITLGQEELDTIRHRELDSWESDDRARAWLVANLGYEHFSFRQLRVIVDEIVRRLPSLEGKLGLLKFILKDRIRGFVQEETDRQTQGAFVRLFESKRLCFFLQCVECVFQIPQEISLRSTRKLVHANNDPVERSLFDAVPEADLNRDEKEVALYIDKHPEVLWWFRNLVGEDYFSIQGYHKDRIYPDFVIQKGRREKPDPTVIVVEAKGSHLMNNKDTTYKKDVAEYFEKVGHAVPWQKLGAGFENSKFRFQIVEEGEHDGWKDELRKFLERS